MLRYYDEADILTPIGDQPQAIEALVKGFQEGNQFQTLLGVPVYFRSGTGSPLEAYSEMAVRWGISKATTGRVLKKLADMDYISLMSFPGRTGSVIYLHSYLSTMFQISDVLFPGT